MQSRATSPLRLPSELDAETGQSPFATPPASFPAIISVGTWTRIELNVLKDKLAEVLSPFEQPGALIMENELSLELDGNAIQLGTVVRRVYASVDLQPGPVLSDDGTVWGCVLQPGTSDAFETLLVE